MMAIFLSLLMKDCLVEDKLVVDVDVNNGFSSEATAPV